MRTFQSNTPTIRTSRLQIAPVSLQSGSFRAWALFTPFVQFEGENVLLKAGLELYLYLYLYLYSDARW